jgi:hypothetical protein
MCGNSCETGVSEWVLITRADGKPLFARVMSTHTRVMGSIFWKKPIRKVYGSFVMSRLGFAKLLFFARNFA